MPPCQHDAYLYLAHLANVTISAKSGKGHIFRRVANKNALSNTVFVVPLSRTDVILTDFDIFEQNSFFIPLNLDRLASLLQVKRECELNQ